MKQQWHVLIGSRSFGKAFPEHLDRLRQAGCVVHPNSVGRAYNEKELLEVLPGMDAIITGTDELTAKAIHHARELKAIVKHGVGLETIDLKAAAQRNIVVSATPGVIHDSVADLTMALILALARWIVPAHASVVSGSWKPFFGVELNAKVLGIVGLGRIGKAVCKRALCFGMTVTAYDPYPDNEFATVNDVSFRSLGELLELSDFVTLHAAAEQTPKPLIGAAELMRMKKSAFLINTARGVLVDEGALAEALKNKQLAGAGIDAFRHEPPLNSPLLDLDNVVLCPHLGGRTVDGQRKMGEMAIENCLLSLRGEKPVHQVVPQ
jgi:D-3-phosphoglycerate dehydrogenase